jgi:hypothetical protein
MIESIKGSIWRSRVNSGLGILFLGSCMLWAIVVISQAAWHVNPVATAFAAMVDRETQLPNY